MADTPKEAEEQLLRRVLQWSYRSWFQANSVRLAPDLSIEETEARRVLTRLVSLGCMRWIAAGATVMTLHGIQETERLGLIEPETIALRRRGLDMLNAMIVAQNGGDDGPMLRGNEEMRADKDLSKMFRYLRTALT